MPSMKLSVPHGHEKQIAAEKLRTFSQTIQDKYGDEVTQLEESWEGDSLLFGFLTKGFRIKGRIDVDDDQVKVDTQLPLAAMIIRGRIEREVRDALNQALA